MAERSYTLDLTWNGKTENAASYDRSYILSATGKNEIMGSADAFSKGDPKRWNPEELLLASLASCQMLWYLYLCASAKIVVTRYEDHPTGFLKTDPAGWSAFAEATLNPKAFIADIGRKNDALALHAKAHEKCLIAHSINFPVKIKPEISGS